MKFNQVNRVIRIIESFADQLPEGTMVENDKNTVMVSIPIEYQTERPSIQQTLDILSLFKNFSNTSVQFRANTIVIFI